MKRESKPSENTDPVSQAEKQQPDAKGRVAIQNLQKEAKNLVKFQLTPDVQVPMETKVPKSILMKVTKMRNIRTGEIAMRVDALDKLDYEFECESLADYAYRLDKEKDNKTAIQDHLSHKIQNQGGGKTNLEMVGPSYFTQGKMMYSQVKDPLKLVQQSTKLLDKK